MSRYELTKTVVMVGMMGAGKTAIGTALARFIGVEFVDSDREIEIAANMPISEIFERFGEVFFRKKETLVLSRLLENKPCVLSTGGGAFLRPENREIIQKSGVSVWLKADIELLWARVKNKNTRPLLEVADPYNTLKNIYESRLSAYQLARLTVDADENYSISEMAHKVTQALQDAPGEVLRKIS